MSVANSNFSISQLLENVSVHVKMRLMRIEIRVDKNICEHIQVAVHVMHVTDATLLLNFAMNYKMRKYEDLCTAIYVRTM